MLTISLLDFIRTGCLGSITLGSHVDEVKELLGGDEDFGDFGETQIIKYGWYEFFYWTDTGIIFGIQNDHLQADCANHGDMIFFSNDTWIMDVGFLKENENITFRQVRQMLEEQNIAYVIEPVYEGCEEQLIRCVDTNVKFDFDDVYSFAEFDAGGNFSGFINTPLQHRDDYILNGIRLFNLER